MPRNDRGDAPVFGVLVKEWRTKRSLSQKRLADLAGISAGYVALIEGGVRGKRPGRDVVIGLAQALEAPVDVFLEAAGRLTDADAATLQQSPGFESVVRSDPRLRADQKQILIDLYHSWVRRPSGE